MVHVPKKYTNGDGFNQEPQVYHVTYRRDVSTDNRDGGFNLRVQVRLGNLVVEHNSRSYRFWNDITAWTLTSKDLAGSHIWLNAEGPQNITIDGLLSAARPPLQCYGSITTIPF